jgi:hypothetical protein
MSTLGLDHDPFFEEEKFKPFFEKFAPIIQRLNISVCDIVKIHFPKLHKLTIKGISLFDDLPDNLEENVEYMLTTHASQIEALQLCYVGFKSVNLAMMLPNLRTLNVFGAYTLPRSTNAVNESILTLKMFENINCFSSVPNLRKLCVHNLNYSIVQKCFQHLPKLEVVEYHCTSFCEHTDSFILFKQDLLSRYNFDFDKENKRNVKFVQKPFSAIFKFQ